MFGHGHAGMAELLLCFSDVAGVVRLVGASFGPQVAELERRLLDSGQFPGFVEPAAQRVVGEGLPVLVHQ